MSRLSGLLFLYLVFVGKLFALNVVVANVNIHFNELISEKMVSTAIVRDLKRHCKPITIDDFKTKKLQATHYMKKGYIICENDVKEYSKKSVLFNFGSIQIEKHGKVIFENDEYIRIKKNNGEIEKIYKDGRIK